MTIDPQPACLSCQRTDSEVPLLQVRYHAKVIWICAEHLPILIHKPQQLASVLPGAEDLQPADHDHD